MKNSCSVIAEELNGWIPVALNPDTPLPVVDLLPHALAFVQIAVWLLFRCSSDIIKV
jgi:hypothetical protein